MLRKIFLVSLLLLIGCCSTVFSQTRVHTTDIRLVENIAALKALHPTVGGTRAEVSGYYSAADGGGGDFFWDDESTDTANDGTIINSLHTTTGRWKRDYTGSVSPLWFGCKADGASDDYAAFKRAIDVAVTPYPFSAGMQSAHGRGLDLQGRRYLLSRTVYTSGITLGGWSMKNGCLAAHPEFSSTGGGPTHERSFLMLLLTNATYSTDVTLDKIVFDCNTLSGGLKILGNIGTIITDCELREMAPLHYGVYSGNRSNELRVITSRFKGTGTQGIGLYAYYDQHIFGSIFTGLDTAIQFGVTGPIVIDNVHVYSCANAIVDTGLSAAITITNSFFGDPLRFLNPKGLVISNCYFNRINTGAAVFLASATETLDYVTFIGNKITAPTSITNNMFGAITINATNTIDLTADTFVTEDIGLAITASTFILQITKLNSPTQALFTTTEGVLVPGVYNSYSVAQSDVCPFVDVSTRSVTLFESIGSQRLNANTYLLP
jgi:hypothetical protein